MHRLQAADRFVDFSLLVLELGQLLRNLRFCQLQSLRLAAAVFTHQIENFREREAKPRGIDDFLDTSASRFIIKTGQTRTLRLDETPVLTNTNLETQQKPTHARVCLIFPLRQLKIIYVHN